MWQTYLQPRTIEQAVEQLAEYGTDARVINGGTDLLFDLERQLRTPRVLIDVSRVPALNYAREDGDYVRIGAGVTHSQVLTSRLLREKAYPLVRACAQIGIPHIRNRGTVGGNLVTASPANDAICALWAMGAEVKLKSVRGVRTVSFFDFFKGARQTSMQPDEMLIEVACSKMTWKDRANYVRLGWDRDEDKALPSVGVVLEFEEDEISNAWITLGAVAPTVVNAIDAEQALVGQRLDDAAIDGAAELATNAIQVDDRRAEMTCQLVGQALRQIRDGQVALPETDLLWDELEPRLELKNGLASAHSHGTDDVIETTVNGKARTVTNASGKILLQFLRDDLGLLNVTKCIDGACGMCMVLLDETPVMSCLVPAPRAHHASIILADSEA